AYLPRPAAPGGGRSGSSEEWRASRVSVEEGDRNRRSAVAEIVGDTRRIRVPRARCAPIGRRRRRPGAHRPGRAASRMARTMPW
ncbi:MAG: hypothetical protein ACK559_04035, partial [bacterium]